MNEIEPCVVPSDLRHHVYVLYSLSRTDLVKVGRSNSPARIRNLKKMHYADVIDWEPHSIVILDSRCAAIAVEAMAHAKLFNQGFGVARFAWTRLPDMKRCFADECFGCAPTHATSVVEEMALLYRRDIA